MLFNTFEFLIFLPIVFIFYWQVFNKSLKTQNLLIFFASYFFYGFFSIKFLGILLIITLLDYFYGFQVTSANKKKSKFFLWLSLINNLGILALFKYYNFFVSDFQVVLEYLGIRTNFTLLSLALPIGISFYTFHGMSYIFDIYRQKIKPIRSFIDYAVFVSFFPLLVAGPIERANHLLPQIQNIRIFKYSQAVQGCRLILWGMFKKIVVADSLAYIVDAIFLDYMSNNAFTLIIGSIAFSFQIYADFSGYSDIALGTAKLFGFELLSNFKFPYFSRDLSEFWRRWHISLSSWFRDYLYIPLGGSLNGKGNTIRNTFIIFLVSGFWHGASWNFILWGFIHACGFLPLLLFNKNREHINEIIAQNTFFPSLKELFQVFRTFIFVTFAWIFFRISDLNEIRNFLEHIFLSIIYNPIQFLHKPGGLMSLIFIIPLVIGDWYLRRDERNLKVIKHKFFRMLLYVFLGILVLMGLFKTGDNAFIYFQF